LPHSSPPSSSNPSPPSSTLVAAPEFQPVAAELHPSRRPKIQPVDEVRSAHNKLGLLGGSRLWMCQGRGGGHVVPARVVQPRPRRGVHVQLLVHRVLVPLRRVLMPLRRSCSGYATPASCSGEDATTEESFSSTRTPLAPQLHLPLENLFVRPLSPPYVKWVTIGSSCWRHLPSLQCPTKTHFLICLSLLEIA
jgi:hypothetical protein